MLVDGLFEFPTGDQLEFPSANIALVGNGGCILNNNNGWIIDSHNVVVRFNNANIKDYTACTGTKTTDLVINCHVYNDIDLKAEGFEAWQSASHVFDKYGDIRVLYVNTNMPGKGRGPIPERMPFYIMNKQHFQTCQYVPYRMPSIPTVGFAMICTLVRSGFKPSLFGFTVDKNIEWDHYFEKRPEASVSHNHKSEISALLDLESKGLIKVYR